MLDDVNERGTNGNARVDRLTSPKIGLIGLGLMGTAMATNLAADGRNVCAYVRRPERINELKALGVAATTRRPDLFDSDIIVTMLPDDAAVRNVVRDIGFATIRRDPSVDEHHQHRSLRRVSARA